MHLGDTIVAIASGPARGARAIIRLSGPGTAGAIDELTGGAAGMAVVLRLDAGAELPALVMRWRGPGSYTGEDAAELLIPGNPLLAERVVQRLVRMPGVRGAEPGEFSARAFLAGRLSLAQAEGVALTIAAQTQSQLDAARAALEGTTGRAFVEWSEKLATLLALVEAGIDFTDQEDVTPIAPDLLRAQLRELHARLTATLGSARGSERADGRPVVALAGAPNAGKSTLFNALLGRVRTVVSPLAGTTRDVIVEPLPLGTDAGLTVQLADLPGLDPSAGGRIDASSQAAARAMLDRAAVILWCDPTGRFDADDAGAPPAARGGGAVVLRVRTQADRAGLAFMQAVDSGSAAAMAVCGLDGRGLGALREAIARAAWLGEGFGTEQSGEGSPATAGSAAERAAGGWQPRQALALRATREHLARAIDLLDAADTESEHHPGLPSAELIAHALRAAMDELGVLTGRMDADAIIGRIFATFCIGK
jgi:tRNA modification GTPase